VTRKLERATRVAVPKRKVRTARPPAGSPASARWTPHLVRGLYDVWCGACLTALIVLIGLRWLRYSSWSTTPMLNDFLREAMVIEAQTFLWAWVFGTVKGPTVLRAMVIVAVCLHRRFREQLVTCVDGVWRLRRLPVGLLLGAMVWLHYGFDINPTVAWICATLLILVTLAEQPRLAARSSHPMVLVASAIVLTGLLVAAHDVVDRIAIGAWALVLLASHRYLDGRIASRHLGLLRTAALIPANLLAAVLPLALPLHGGRHLGDGLAYSFCEVPGRGTVYATIPVCDSVQAGYEACRDGRVVEYDLGSMQRVAAYNFLTPDFNGRLELMVCLDDEVQVSVQGTIYQGRSLVQSAMSFPVASPTQFTPLVAEPGVGNSIAYDRAHEAIFYTGEFNNRVVRYDRRTKQFDDSLTRYFPNPWFQPLSMERYTGSLTLYTNSIHPGRNRIYMAEWMHGRYAYAIDLTALRPVARYDVGGGGTMGVTVDVDRDRLLVSSVWGLEVFDLATDRLILRKRTGVANRPVIIDTARNQLYLTSTLEGKIRILDRDTFDVIGQIPIGIGTRYAYLSRDGSQLFGSSAVAHYYWDADTLARPRASGPEPSPRQ